MKARHAFFSVLLAGAGAAGVAASPAVQVELRPEVRADSSPVLLGQVARLESTDLALLRRLVDLPVGRLPAVGDSAVLEREALAGWLQRRLGLAAEQVEWRGTATTRVLSSGRMVPGDQVAAAAAEGLRQWLTARALRGEVELVAAPRDFEAPPGELQLRTREPGHAQLRPRMTLWVEAWAAGRFVRVIPVVFSVSAAGAGAWATDGTAVQNAAGNAVRQPAPAPVVLRGEWAALHAGAGAVRTEARVQVLQDGRLGDKVRVRPSAAGATLLARVTGPGLLELAP